MPFVDINKRYRFQREIGRGAYGSVWSADDLKSAELVAIKKVGARNFDEQILAKRALREIKLLRHLNGHENMPVFIDVDTNDSTEKFTELYLVEGLMEADLHQIIRSGQSLTDQHFQYFLYQICKGLKWMHSANIIHRDLKPGNLLINSDCELRICDFGLARGLDEPNAHLVNTEYVATRYYRAPEVVLSPKHYSKAIDIWSVGCIFGEMINSKIMFKGSDYIDQLQRIFQVLGTPEDPSLTVLCSSRVLKYLRSWPKYKPAVLKTIFPSADNKGLSLMQKLLAFNPSARITAEQALADPYLASYSSPEDEPNHPTLFDFAFEKAQAIPDVKVLISREVTDWRAERAKEGKRRSTQASSPNRSGPPPHVQDKMPDIPRFQDTEVPANGAHDIEEEIQRLNIV